MRQPPRQFQLVLFLLSLESLECYHDFGTPKKKKYEPKAKVRTLATLRQIPIPCWANAYAAAVYCDEVYASNVILLEIRPDFKFTVHRMNKVYIVMY